MSRLLDGKAVAATIRNRVADGVAELVATGRRPPTLAAVLVGDDPASHVYVRNKAQACAEAGMTSRRVDLPATIGADELTRIVDDLNADPEVDGILVQLPLPPGLPEREIIHRVTPDKDVDGFHPVNVGRLWLGEDAFVPATPAGVIELLKTYEVPLKGARATIVGRSSIVGKPMAALLLREHCTVTICHSRTRDLAAACREADILVAAVGSPHLLGPDHVREGAVVIDVGTNRISTPEEVDRLLPPGHRKRDRFAEKGWILVGDVDFPRVRERAGAITPVPGGVGPLTIARLLVNTLEAATRQLA